MSRLTSEEKNCQSEKVQNLLFNDIAYKNAQSVAVYLHMDDEIRTLDILKDALSAGKKCFIPRYFSDGGEAMQMVRIKDMDDYQSLPLTKWKIKQPEEDELREEAVDPDLILIPGLAFTKDGFRLGRGKGYYDRYLDTKGKNSRTIALCFKEQIVDKIPIDETDVKIAKVLFVDS